MGEKQVKVTSPLVLNAWGSMPSQERQRELEAMLDQQLRWVANTPESRSPRESALYEKRLTGADVFWLAARTLAGTGEVSKLAEQGRLLLRAHDDDALGIGLHLDKLHLEGASLYGAHLERAFLFQAHLEGVFAHSAVMFGAYLYQAHLQHAGFMDAHLEHADLTAAHLEGASFFRTHLERASLCEAHLEGVRFSYSQLEGADFRDAFFNSATELRTAAIASSKLGAVLVGGVRWGDVDLSELDWRTVRRLGDEDWVYEIGAGAAHISRLFAAAGRAYRSLSLVLRAQGLNSHASRFQYRAEVMSRCALFHRTRALFDKWWMRYTPLVLVSPFVFVPWFLSWLFGAVAGYGVYHIWRLFLTYLALVAGFAAAYLFLSQQVHLSLPSVLDSLALSVSAFHGRGIQPSSGIREDMLWLSGLESLVGLMVEALFVAALTRRVAGS